MKQTILLLFLLLAAGCKKEIEPNFSFSSETEITLEGSADAEKTFSFTSAREWKASTTADWLDISPVSGDAGKQSITLTATSANETGKNRSTTVLLSSLSLTRELKISQVPDDYVTPEQDTYLVPAAGENLRIRFTTNVDANQLAIYGSADWLTQDLKTRADLTYEIALRALPNTDKGARTAYISFYKQKTDSLTFLNAVVITQEGTGAGTSTDYSADKTVRVLQRSKVGNGLPIVIMGDGFIDTEIADSTYDKVMDQTLENLFTEEPIKSLRDYFDVYAVTAVSRNNSFGKGYETAFSCEYESATSSLISGDDDAVMEYVSCIDDIAPEEALVVVVLNSPVYGGTTYFGYADEANQIVEFAIAYCPVIENPESESFRQILAHEAVGHGFGKLDDEYGYAENGRMPESEIKSAQEMQKLGWLLNVDFTDDESKVLWHEFIGDSRYAAEKIGIYEGACTYVSGAYRPTNESMMRSNIEGFNAPSRRAIYGMVMKRATRQEPTYEDFVKFDLPTRKQARTVKQAVHALTKPLPRPRFVHKKRLRSK